MRTTQVKSRLGTFVYPTAWEEDSIVRDIRESRLHDWRVAEAMVRWFEPGTAIIDVGCNLGQMSVCVARASQRLCGSESAAQIIAIQARSSLAHLAKDNFALNDIYGTVIEGAAWHEPNICLPLADIDLSRVESVGSLGVTASSGPSMSHSARSILLEQIPLDRRVSVLKLDIQGSELNALLGATELIRSHSPIIIFEFEEMFAPQFGVTFGDYIQLLDALGYRIREVVGSNNYLAIPESDFVSIYAKTFEKRRRRLDLTQFLLLAATA